MTMIMHGAPPFLGGFGIPKVLKKAVSQTITLAKNSGIPVVSQVAAATRAVSTAVSPPKQAAPPAEPPPTQNPLSATVADAFAPVTSQLDAWTGGNGKWVLIGVPVIAVAALVLSSKKGS